MIKQPEFWAQWVRNTVETIEDGTLTNPQKLINKAALKYAKIIASEGTFNASSNSIQQDIVAMISNMKPSKPKPTTRLTKQQQSSKKGNWLKYKYYYVNSKQAPHKVGNTKAQNIKKYYSFDVKHFHSVHWHKHRAKKCKLWASLQNNNTNTITEDKANLDTENRDYVNLVETPTSEVSDTKINSPTVQALYILPWPNWATTKWQGTLSLMY